MTNPRTRSIFLAITGLCLVGAGACGNRGTATTTVINEEPWFCQMSGRGAQEPWDCVQDPEQVSNPRPTRLPSDVRTADAASDASAEVPVDDASNALTPSATGAGPADDAAASEPVDGAEPEPTADDIEIPVPQPDLSQATTAPEPAAGDRDDPPDYVSLAYTPPSPVSILDLPKDYFAVQLTALNSPQAVEEFVSKHNLQGMSAAQVASGKKLHYVLILGIYESEAQARRALEKLPGPLAQFDPWLRRVGNLQQAMIDAQRLLAARAKA